MAEGYHSRSACRDDSRSLIPIIGLTGRPMPSDSRQDLQAIRDRLLALHKTLLDRERADYERAHEPIDSPGTFLQLVIGHPQFEWLRQLSSLVVEIDEMLAPRSKAGAAEAAAIVNQIRRVLTRDEEGNKFQIKYRQAVQEAPEVLTAHRELTALLKRD